MKKILLFFAVTIIAISCVRVPITKRKQLNLLSEAELIAMADTAYAEFLASHKVLADSDPKSQKVNRVGKKIASAVEVFLKKHNAMERVEGFNWQFKVVEESAINAWCMPGGKVVVYTGILPLAANDTLLAVVMGHEIAHAIARHGNERMSEQFALQGLGQVLGGAMQDTTRRNIFLQSYGIASTLKILQYSRGHETEADKMGLVFMYLAGYNPARAIDFWEKMAAHGAAVPEWLSTHPSDERRINDIKAYLPDVKKYAE